MRPAVLLVLLSAVVVVVSGQACPGAKPPALTSAQSGAMTRARTLGYVPTDTQVNNAVNVQRIKRLLSQDKFNYLFPMANLGAGPSASPYNYQNFLKAAAMFPDFCNNAYGSANLDTTCLNELSTMFSMFSQETGAHNPSSSIPEWRQGLYYYTEVACTPPSGAACAYCQSQNVYNYPCVSGKYYYGRGPFQLSWNYNYGYFSYVVLGDAYTLLNNPDQLTTSSSSWLSFASALWFYMTPQNPKPSMHDVATGYWIPNSADTAAGRKQGFGAQIMIINGGLECGGPSESAHAANRISYFRSFTSYFGISAGSNTGCANMRQFDSSGSAAIPQHWERSWTTNCACQLVSYTTAWSIYDHVNVAVPYQNCLNHYFGDSSNPGGGGSETDCSKLTPCYNGCKSCKAVASCTTQWVTDEHCAPCGTGQTWWPCNLSPAACYCFS